DISVAQQEELWAQATSGNTGTSRSAWNETAEDGDDIGQAEPVTHDAGEDSGCAPPPFLSAWDENISMAQQIADWNAELSSTLTTPFSDPPICSSPSMPSSTFIAEPEVIDWVASVIDRRHLRGMAGNFILFDDYDLTFLATVVIDVPDAFADFNFITSFPVYGYDNGRATRNYARQLEALKAYLKPRRTFDDGSFATTDTHAGCVRQPGKPSTSTRLDAAHGDARASPGHAETASCASTWRGAHSDSWAQPDYSWQANTDNWHQASQSGSSNAWSQEAQSVGNASWSKRPYLGGTSWSKQPRRDVHSWTQKANTSGESWNMQKANTSGESWSKQPRRDGHFWTQKANTSGESWNMQKANTSGEHETPWQRLRADFQAQLRGPGQEEPDAEDVFPSLETRDEDWWFLARESGKIDPERPLSCAEVVQATLLEPDPVKLEERVEMLHGIVCRAPSSLLYDLAEAFGRAGVDIGKCESWTDTGFAFLRANVETVRPPDIWCAKWYNYTFLHGTTLLKAAYILHENMVRPYSWGDQDYPSYAFYARVVQSELEQWAVKSLCKKIMTIGKGQQGALILGLMRSPMQHSKMQAGGTTVEQHAARHAYIVRGVDGRFAVRSDYAVPTAVIVCWPE
ncbi:unnamed protein product, partial [Symbiodinium necroappetens]